MKRNRVLWIAMAFALVGVRTTRAEKVIYEQDPTLLTTTIQIVFTTGTMDDPKGKSGLANFLSELMLRGTKKRARSVFQSELERLGAQIGVHNTTDNTIFIGQVIRENTIPFLALMEDCLIRPAFAKKEFDALKTELLADVLHHKNSNGRLAGLALRRELFAGTALERPGDGTLSTIKSITPDDMNEGYKRMFNRGNLLFGFASSAPQSELQASIDAIYAGLPEGAKIKRDSVPPKPPVQPTILVVHKAKTSTGNVLMGQSGITISDKYRYTLGVANFAFGGEPLVSRLFRIVRSELGWTYAVNSTYSAAGPLSNQQGLYLISTTPSVEFTVKTIIKVLALWNEFLKEGLKSEELTLAHESLVNSYPFEFDSAEKRLSQKMYSEIYSVPILSPDEYKKTIRNIGNSEIKEALKARQTAGGWLISMVADVNEIARQLEAEQKDVPKDRRLVISKTMTPDQVIQ